MAAEAGAKAASKAPVSNFPNYLMALFFCYAAVIQLNDPDKGLWMTVYAASAAACILNTISIGPAIVALTALIIAGTAGLFVQHIADSPPGTFLDVGTEPGREGGGLMVVLVWLPMALLVPRFKWFSVLAFPVALSFLACIYIVPRYVAKISSYGTAMNPDHCHGIGITWQELSSS